MENFLLGEYIKQRRLDLGLTQGEVCAGICDTITLSRLENGRQTPSRSRIKAILQRLGLPDSRYIALMSKNELELEALKQEIESCNAFRRVDEGFEKLARLEQLAEPDDQLTRQFILRSRVVLGHAGRRYTHRQALALLEQAIRLTSPRFDPDEVERGLYTVDEIRIISLIAITYSEMDQNRKAADLYYQLLRYIRRHLGEVSTSGEVLPGVLYNYARVLDLCGHYQEGLDYAREGKAACLRYGQYQFLPGCTAIYAECCHFLHRDAESLRCYRQAYYLYQAFGDERNREIVEQEAWRYHSARFED